MVGQHMTLGLYLGFYNLENFGMNVDFGNVLLISLEYVLVTVIANE